jgi:predicted SprT family Zn-dependent metalloprotease
MLNSFFIKCFLAVTAALLQVNKSLSLDQIENLKDKVKHELEHYNVHHSTIEIYFNDREFKEEEML